MTGTSLKALSVGAAAWAFATGSCAQSNSGNTNSFNNNVCSAFGDNATTICNPARIGFSDELGDQLVKHMPDKSKPVDLRTIGGNIDQTIGSQAQDYLIKHGYKVQRTAIGVMAPPADYPFTLQMSGDQYHLTVAPSAH
jgi:hypothetical protein